MPPLLFPHLTSVLRLIAAVCLFAMAALAMATPTSDLRFKRLGSLDADDLSILSMLQDRQGFVWIGTHSGGLYRYNGYQAVKYTHDTRGPGSLPNDRVSALFEDHLGRIWAGTQDGLARFDPASGTFTALALPPGPSNQRIVKAIVGDGASGMWVATWGGLQHVDSASGAVRRYLHDKNDPDSLGANDINALARDADGGLWVATWPGGLDYLAKGATGFRHYRIDTAQAPDDKLNIVRALHVGADGTLWIGTEAGVVTWNSRSPWSTRTRIASPRVRINALHADAAGAMWAGTLAAGLWRWDPGAAVPVHYAHRANDPHSLQSDHIRAVMTDRSGMLWVASFTDGISLVNLNSHGFQRFIPFDAALDNTLPNNSVQNMETAPGGRLWLGSNTGFSLFDPANGAVIKTWRAEPGRPGGLSSDVIYSLHQQDQGPLWIGTASGLNRLDQPGGAFQTVRFGKYAKGASTAMDFINTIAPGAGGMLWLGTGQHLVRYHPASGAVTVYPTDADNPAARSVTGTTCIVEDRRGRVWMGSDWSGGGLDMLDPATGTFRHFRSDHDTPGKPATLADDNVATVYQDPRGRIWAGTAKGLSEVITGADGAISFRNFGGADSVGAVKILAIRSDQAGMLWLSTASGLVRMDPVSGKVTRFSTADGLTEGFAANSATAGADGVLYFGGVKGMTGVHAQQVRRMSVAPQVALTDVSVFNRSLATGAAAAGAGIKLAGTVTAPTAITLSVQESVFALEFSSLHYTDPARNTYAHRLIGFDRDWVITDANHRTATYTNLDPGSYRFEVKAANEQGIWSAQAATVTIRILPPWWQTWWARLLGAVLATGLLVMLYRARVRSLTRRQKDLQALVAARTGELEESNAKLATLSSTDGLTGITNRRGFDAALDTEWRRARRNGSTLALAMLDVDHFKSYNDCYGHQAGDHCLRMVADVIESFGRRPGDLVARYGGEEFTVLAPATDAAEALAIANAICVELARLALPHAASPYAVVTVSIGVAALNPGELGEATESALLVGLADQALYRAKQAGRNRAALATPMAPGKRTLASKA
ncbi:ligand-binding sensor domain-containing diguanylate cyclase [Massilia sp. DWR3-1-1]|uniref:ligand-binding sensor domain-containing diguanylate cyclase n=1 Tax=Massilia sp. DWR3-1-1 TaxID=2804559 RepID=UPI003CF8807E